MEGFRRSFAGGESTVYGQHLTCEVIIRFQEETDSAGDIQRISEPCYDFLVDKGIVLSAGDTLFSHS